MLLAIAGRARRKKQPRRCNIHPHTAEDLYIADGEITGDLPSSHVVAADRAMESR